MQSPQNINNQKKIIQIFKSFIQKALVPQIKKMQGSLFQWNKFNQILNNTFNNQAYNFNQLQFYVDSLGGQSPDRNIDRNSINGPIIGQQQLSQGQQGYTSSFDRNKDNLSRFPPHIKKNSDDQSNNILGGFNPNTSLGSSNSQPLGFNPSKTFGGDRARLMFPLKGATGGGNSNNSNNTGNNSDFEGVNSNSSQNIQQFNPSSTMNSNTTSNLNKSLSSTGNLNSFNSNTNQISAQMILPGMQKLAKIFQQNQSKLENNFYFSNQVSQFSVGQEYGKY